MQSIQYLLSIANFKNSPGLGWEQVLDYNIWIYEFYDVDSIERDELVIKTIDKFFINATSDCDLNLHLNVADVDGYNSIRFCVDFLKKLNARNCTITIDIIT